MEKNTRKAKKREGAGGSISRIAIEGGGGGGGGETAGKPISTSLQSLRAD